MTKWANYNDNIDDNIKWLLLYINSLVTDVLVYFIWKAFWNRWEYIWIQISTLHMFLWKKLFYFYKNIYKKS
jgi:hypothetical protein